eukprot:g18853.t2
MRTCAGAGARRNSMLLFCCAGCFGRRVAVVTLQVVAEVGVPALGFEELRCFDVSAGAEGRVRVCSGGGC